MNIIEIYIQGVFNSASIICQLRLWNMELHNKIVKNVTELAYYIDRIKNFKVEW